MENFYPYQQTSLDDLPEETWKDIPGFEGYYQVSTHGRIKSLSRYIIRCTQRVGFWTKDKIMIPYLSAGYNRFLDQYTYRVAIKLYKDNKSYPVSVARYVYTLFVEDFDLSNPEHIITYKDGNSQNIHYSNLLLTTQQQIHRICFAKKRRQAPNVSTARSVTQYDLSGKKIITHSTVQAASLAVNQAVKSIYQAVSKQSRRVGGTYWRYEDVPLIDVTLYQNKRRKRKKNVLFSATSLPDVLVPPQAALTETNRDLGGLQGTSVGSNS